MNATELFHADGSSSGVYYCAQCKEANSQEIAEKCCKPFHCDKCNTTYDQRTHYCFECSEAEHRQKMMKKLEEAELVDDYKVFFFSEEIPSSQDGYFTEWADLIESAITNDLDIPKFVFACYSRKLELCTEEILQRLEDNGYEGICDAIEGVEILEGAVTDFNDLNAKALTVYEVDYSKKVRVPPELIAGALASSP